MEYKICEELKNISMKTMKSYIKEPKIYDAFEKEFLKKKNQDNFMKTCKNAYYNNENCDGTIFQNGKDHSRIIDEIINNTPNLANLPEKNKKEMKIVLLETRKGIFKSKSSVLKNGFYKKLTKKDIKMIKDKSGTSGCTLINALASKSLKKAIKNVNKSIKKSRSVKK
jgi:hypothetical protein